MMRQVFEYAGIFFLGFATYLTIFFTWRFVAQLRKALKEMEIIKNAIVAHQNVLGDLKKLTNAGTAANAQEIQRVKKEMIDLMGIRQPLTVVKENENGQSEVP